MPALRLQDEGFEVVLWFMNPNIQPFMEYVRRREAAEECAERLGVKIYFDDAAWNLKNWLEEQKNNVEMDRRCQWCCQSRLTAAYATASINSFNYFSTSLLYSRYQPHEAIKEKGCELAQQGASRFVYRDFREDWQAGIDKSREWGIYRQPYCGCVFSEAERYSKKLGLLIDSAPTLNNSQAEASA